MSHRILRRARSSPPFALLHFALYLCLSVVIGRFPLLAAPSPDAPQLVSVKKLWDGAHHNAFTDLARFSNQWFCTFRESQAHVGGNGKIRVLSSADGDRWESAALLGEEGIDLRDPKLSLAPDGRLMLVLGGSVYEGKTLKERQSRVAFSIDGRAWTTPQRVLQKGDWLWRVTWHQDHAYGITYASMRQAAPTNEWRITLVESKDGLAWNPVTKLAVPGQPNEATVRFLPNDDCIALVRREGPAPGADKAAWIGRSSPPYTDWHWIPAGMQIGGPNFLVLPGGALVAGGRQYNAKPASARTFVGRMTLESVSDDLILPSGGDCSYPGMVWHDGLLWVSYYSTHEGKTSIYLARIRIPGQKP
ncbi:MAG: exo-alpha-sialidase [Armatimonadota bacterium]